jgi:hypothetical protein
MPALSTTRPLVLVCLLANELLNNSRRISLCRLKSKIFAGYTGSGSLSACASLAECSLISNSAAQRCLPHVFFSSVLPSFRAHIGQAKDKTASSPQAQRLCNKKGLCQLNTRPVVRDDFVHQILSTAAKYPGHWLFDKKRPGTKGRIDGNQSKTYKGLMVWAHSIPLCCQPTFSSSLVILLLGLLPGCSTQPQSHPLDTKPVPRDAQFLAECSIKGVMACRIMSALSGDYGAEKGSACIAYRDSNWKLVEQCGSLPATQP